MPRIPVERLFHIGVVVKDARAAAERYARIHGITRWEVVDWTSARLGPATTHGFYSDQGYRTATGSATLKDGSSMTFQLIEPTDGWTTFHEFLLTRGEGIHSICTASLTSAELEALTLWLANEGIGVGQSASLDGSIDSVFFDTRKALGGFYVQVLAPRTSNGADVEPDEVWDLSPLVAPAGPLYVMTAFQHFGLVITDLMERVRSWSRLFDVKEWNFRDWHTGPGSLEHPTYLEKPVDHAYFTSTVTVGDGVAFEIIQPTFGPSHYKEDYLQRIGEGIHHLHATRLDSDAEWRGLKERMATAGAPEVMGGGILQGFLDFYYLDMRAALGGYVMEVIVPGPNFGKGRPNLPWAMSADLSRPVEPSLLVSR